MKPSERHEEILSILKKSEWAVKGADLAISLGVTRQVIVQDMALLRARGEQIIATPSGYLSQDGSGHQHAQRRFLLACCHNEGDFEQEMGIIVAEGGLIEDVIVEHPIYGEIKGVLMISTLEQVHEFAQRVKATGAPLLSVLSGGIHLHTVAVDSVEAENKIREMLVNAGCLVS